MPATLLGKIKSRTRALAARAARRFSPPVNARVIRERIYSFQFADARKLLGTGRAKAELKPKTINRFLGAIDYNETARLMQRIDDAPQSTRRATSKSGSVPIAQGKWWVRGIDERRVLIRGTVNKECHRVALFVNDRVVRFINTDELAGDPEGRRMFRFNIKADAMSCFPPNASIAFGSMDGFLVRRGGKLLYKNELINGDGSLFEKLEGDYFVNKKGQLKITLDRDEDWKERAMLAYMTLKEYFERTFGYKLYFICGTLLGHTREGDFIPHDDDLDVSFLSKETSPEDVKREMQEIVLQMLLDGFDIKLARRPGFFKPKINGVKIDVTPMWHDQGDLWMLNATHLRDGPGIIEPVQPGVFRGHDVYVPHHPERVLELEYGPGWRVPDPGYRTHFAPDEQKYLLRSCMTTDEIKAFYERVLSEASKRDAMGRLTAVSVDLDALVRDQSGSASG